MSSRLVAIVSALALGLGGAAAAHHYDLIPFLRDEDASEGTATTRRPNPSPTSGSKSGSVESADEIETPATLVPKGSFLYLEVASVATVEGLVRNIVTRFQPGMASSMSADMMLQQMLQMVGGDAAQIDERRPFGAALSMPVGGVGQPVATLILPVHEPTAFTRTLRMPPGFAPPQVGERYVGITMGPTYELGDGPEPVTVGLPDTPFALRVRLEPVMPMIQPAMQQARAQADMMASSNEAGAAAYLAGYDYAQQFIESVEQFDLGLDMSGERMDVQFAMDVREGSDFAVPMESAERTVSDLVGYLGDGDTISAVVSWDQRFIDKLIRPMLDTLGDVAETEEEQEAFDRMEQMLALMPMFGEELVVSGRFEVGGMRVALFCRPGSPDALVQSFPIAIGGMDLASHGVIVSEPEVEEMDGGRAIRLQLSLDGEVDDPMAARMREGLELLFGTSEIELRLASKNGHLGLVVGGDFQWQLDQLSRLGDGAGELEGDFAEAFQRVEGGRPVFVYQLDMLSLSRGMISLIAEQMGMDPSEDLGRLTDAVGEEPLTMTVYTGVEGTRWSGGMMMDWTRFFSFVQATAGQF